MDKRILIAKRPYSLLDGRSFEAYIYLKKSSRNSISIRVVYGCVEVYVSGNVSFQKIDEFVIRCLSMSKYNDHVLNRPFMKEGVYVYVEGKKRYFTRDASLKGNPRYVYLPARCKEPLGEYKLQFLSYLYGMIPYIGNRMGVDLSQCTIRTGLFLSYYGCCFPRKKLLKFDYRLFAYKPEITYAILVHEVAHMFEIYHNDRFYEIVHRYCKDYDRLEHLIECGKFEGELDDYVFSCD